MLYLSIIIIPSLILKITKNLKLTSHRTLHYLCSQDLSKGFFQLTVSIFIFSQYFCQSIDFAWWKSVELPHIAYIMINACTQTAIRFSI